MKKLTILMLWLVHVACILCVRCYAGLDASLDIVACNYIDGHSDLLKWTIGNVASGNDACENVMTATPKQTPGILEECSDVPSAEALLRVKGDALAATKNVGPLLNVDFIAEMGKNAVDPTAYTAACCLVAPQKMSVYALYGNDDWIAIRVNGQRIVERRRSSPGRRPRQLVEIPLEKGANLVVVSIVNLQGGAGFRMDCFTERSVAVAEALTRHGTLIEQTGQPSDLKLALAQSLSPLLADLQVKVIRKGMTHNDEVVYEKPYGRMEAELPQLKPGFYSVEVATPTATYIDAGVIGNPRDVLSVIESLGGANAGFVDYIVNSERLKFLLDRKEIRLPDANWATAVSDTLRDLFEAAQLRSNPQSITFSSRGVHMAGLKSDIDGVVRGYRYGDFTLPQRKGASKPALFVILPTPIKTNASFLQSPFVRSHISAREAALAAAPGGALVVWPGYSNAPLGAPIELAYLDEILKDVVKRCNGDVDRVFLYGACGGANLALRAVTEWPARFRGVCLHNPTVGEFGQSPGKGDYDVAKLATREEQNYLRWSMAMHPVEDAIGAIAKAKIPVLITNDHPLDGHGTIEQARWLRSELRNNAIGVDFDDYEDVFGRAEEWEKALAWTAHKSEDRRLSGRSESGEIALWKGSVAHVFTKRFLVVKGSHGERVEQEWMARIASEFSSNWTVNHYGIPRVKFDYEVTENELAGDNLVLIGNPECNLTWGRLASRIDVKLEEQSVRISSRKWVGPGLAIQACVKDNELPGRSFLLLGGRRFSAINEFPFSRYSIEGDWAAAVFLPGDRDHQQVMVYYPDTTKSISPEKK